MSLSSSTVTPKGFLVVKDVGGKSAVEAGGKATFKVKRSDVAAALTISDQSLRNPRAMKDVLAEVDWRLTKHATLNTKYDFGPKKGAIGGTYEGIIARKAVNQKLLYRQSDNKLAGETTVALAVGQKANAVYTNERLQSVKYSVTRDDYCWEPSYNFEREAAAMAVTRQLARGDTVKVSYDLKSRVAAAEWARRPVKLIASAAVTDSGIGRMSLLANFENTYNF